MLDIDVAGVAIVTEDGIEIERAPEGSSFKPLDEAHARLGTLVGPDEKFAAHNAALWKHGLLVVVPRGVVVEQPLYVGSPTRSRAARSSSACSSSPRRARVQR